MMSAGMGGDVYNFHPDAGLYPKLQLDRFTHFSTAMPQSK